MDLCCIVMWRCACGRCACMCACVRQGMHKGSVILPGAYLYRMEVLSEQVRCMMEISHLT